MKKSVAIGTFCLISFIAPGMSFAQVSDQIIEQAKRAVLVIFAVSPPNKNIFAGAGQ